MKRKMILVLSGVLVVVMPLIAETEKVGDYTWTFDSVSYGVEIFKPSRIVPWPSGEAAISPKPTGGVVIPATLGDRPVSSIGDFAFYGCSGLTSVTIPSSVTSIGEGAFWKCSSLISVTLPASIVSIKDMAFADCKSLTSVTIPDGVTSIEKFAFSGCDCLTSVTIPDSVTRIGDAAFSGSRLSAFEVSAGNQYYKTVSGLLLTKDGKTLVAVPSGLTIVTIPASVTSIGGGAFSGCDCLTSVTIPDSVTSIGESAFFGCDCLTSVTIPDSVREIGKSAFMFCDALKVVYLPDSLRDRENVHRVFPITTKIKYRGGYGFVFLSLIAVIGTVIVVLKRKKRQKGLSA